jgi:hypothetical protein
MADSALTPWRDIAIVLLAIEMAVMVAVPGVIFYFAIRGIRMIKRRLVMPMLLTRLWVVRVENATMRVSHAMVAMPITIDAAEARIKTTLHGLAEWLGLS